MTICRPVCGDGINIGGEVCDDGNADDGDGCNGSCNKVEEDYTCLSKSDYVDGNIHPSLIDHPYDTRCYLNVTLNSEISFTANFVFE